MFARNRILHYVGSAALVAFASLIRAALSPYVALDVPFITFFAAVSASAWYSGLGPSLLTTGLSAVAAAFLFIPPYWSFAVATQDLVPVAMFCAEATALAYFTHLLHQRTKQAQQRETALRESEERLRLAMDGAGMGAWDVDLRTGDVRWDSRQHALFGLAPDRPPATIERFYQLIHESDRTRIKQATSATESTGVFHEEFRIVRPDGAIRWIAGKGTLLRDSQGMPLRMVGVNYDITERKEAQQRTTHFAEQLEREVKARTGELLRSQNDLRALATELNLAEQRERKRLAAELHDHLAQMLVLVNLKIGQAKQGPPLHTSGMIEQAQKLLNDALTYTRMLVADLSPPVLHEFGLIAALRWLGQQMKRFDLNVTVQINAQDDHPLPEDRAILLFQSTRELLINVAKHAGTKDVVLKVEAEDGTLKIAVRDQGVGFVPSVGSEVSATSVSSKFGLFSIRERMHAMGGRFQIDSAIGQGTTATLTIPLERSRVTSKETQPTPPRKRNGTSTVTGSAGLVSRVLIVDDHAMVRQGLRSLLAGYDDIEVIGEAANGLEAVMLTETLKPSVVVMDLNMPLMNGIEATAKIKTRHSDVIVIGVSVNASSESRDAMIRAGATLLLTKEAAVEQLHRAIQEATNGNGLDRN